MKVVLLVLIALILTVITACGNTSEEESSDVLVETDVPLVTEHPLAENIAYYEGVLEAFDPISVEVVAASRTQPADPWAIDVLFPAVFDLVVINPTGKDHYIEYEVEYSAYNNDPMCTEKKFSGFKATMQIGVGRMEPRGWDVYTPSHTCFAEDPIFGDFKYTITRVDQEPSREKVVERLAEIKKSP